jgi:prolipoprotein diacylglyceryl transferase
MMGLPSITWSVDPVLFRAEGGQLRYYNVIYCAEIVLGYWLLRRQLRRAGADDEEAGDLTCYLLPAVLVGGRLGHVLFYDLEQALGDPWWIPKIWTGGFAGHGAALGIAVASYLFMRRRDMPWLESTDRLTFSVAAAAMLHRFGNLMNSELPGRPTDGSWGVRFPRFDRVWDGPLRHPTQLYEAALGALVLIVLVLCDRTWGKEQRPRGALTGVLLLTLFSGRFVIEQWKDTTGEPQLPLLSMGQLLSLPCIAAGAFVLLQSLRRRERAGWVVGS